jgi:hypothetical protein
MAGLTRPLLLPAATTLIHFFVSSALMSFLCNNKAPHQRTFLATKETLNNHIYRAAEWTRCGIAVGLTLCSAKT